MTPNRRRSRPLVLVSSRVLSIDIYDEFGRKEITVPSKIVDQNVTMGQHARIAVHGYTESVGRSFHAEGGASWLRST